MLNKPNTYTNKALFASVLGAISTIGAVVLTVLLASCASKTPPPQAPAAPSSVSPGVVSPPAVSSLPPVSSWAEYRRRAARLIMAANTQSVDTGPLPERLLGIPVVQVQLNADGSLRAVDVLRASKVAPETTDPALQAIRRVGNFGPVGNLPQPWQFSETFLYNDGLRFQLRTVVEKL